jgi:hypothetical protein
MIRRKSKNEALTWIVGHGASAFRGNLLQFGSGRRRVNRIDVCPEAVGTASNDIRSFLGIN